MARRLSCKIIMILDFWVSRKWVIHACNVKWSRKNFLTVEYINKRKRKKPETLPLWTMSLIILVWIYLKSVLKIGKVKEMQETVNSPLISSTFVFNFFKLYFKGLHVLTFNFISFTLYDSWLSASLASNLKYIKKLIIIIIIINERISIH